MKNLSLFLVLVILLSLCACSKNEAQNTDPGSDLSQSSTDKAGEATNNTTEEEQKPTENSTAASSEGVKETTKQPTPEGNKQEPVETTKEPATAPTDKPDENPTDKPDENPADEPDEDPADEPDEDPADEPDEDPADEPSDCEHTYPTVTCTIPKICTKCHYLAGKALLHNYQNGSCTVCGMAENLLTFREGYWVAYTVKAGTSEQGEILSEYVLAPKLDRFSSYRGFSNASACFLDKGKITYNDKAYHSDWYYTTYLGCTYEENGNTITFKVGHETTNFEFVVTKTSETQLTVISSTNTAYVPVEIVFVKQ